MEKAEALRRVKLAEADARRIREEGVRVAAQITKDASVRAAQIVEEARTAAIGEFEANLTAARREVAKEREVLLVRGRQDAQAIAARRGVKNFEKAVEVLISRFEQRIG